jgi:hypothetical protein
MVSLLNYFQAIFAPSTDISCIVHKNIRVSKKLLSKIIFIAVNLHPFYRAHQTGSFCTDTRVTLSAQIRNVLTRSAVADVIVTLEVQSPARKTYRAGLTAFTFRSICTMHPVFTHSSSVSYILVKYVKGSFSEKWSKFATYNFLNLTATNHVTI